MMAPVRDASLRRGFTLLELLIVVSIIAFMAIISLPNIASTMRGLQISQGGQLIETQLQAARQRALSDNRTVEMRFYKSAATTGGASHFTAFQAFSISTTGTTATPIDKVHTLPSSMVIDTGDGQTTDDGKTLSTIMGKTPVASTQLLNPAYLPSGQTYTCVFFRFKPDGSTDLTPVSNSWFLTVHALTDGDPAQPPTGTGTGSGPKNYYTIQVDPYNGHIYEFHP